MNKEKCELIKTLSEDLLERCHRFRKDETIDRDYWPNLAGMCGLASMTLSKILNDHNIENYVIVGTYDDILHDEEQHFKWEFVDHVWILVEDYIIDITFSQFQTSKNSDVLFEKVDSVSRYREVNRYKNPSCRIFRGWDDEERPNAKLIKKLMNY